MSPKLQISLLTAVIALIAGVVLLYWWDSTYEETIAEGVTIGGVEVGGLEAEAAASQVRTSLIEPLDRNVVARYGNEKFKLRADQIDVRADVEGMVADAVEASREGNILTRTVRRIGGGEVDHRVRPRIAYSQSSVEGFVEGIAAKLDREPRDASVDPSSGGLEPVASKKGRTVNEQRLRKDVERALQDPGERTVDVKAERVKPEVTTEELASEYPVYLTVDRSNFQLHYYENLKLVETYTIAVGAIGFDTPAGLYHIQSKAVDPTWNVPDSDWAGKLAGEVIPPGPENPLKARWMGIYDGAGIHGTDDTGSLGSAASHGCIRMSVVDVTELYDRVPTGAPIYIG